MNNPRVPTRIATASPFRSDETLTHLCKLLPEAVLRSTLSLAQEQARLARLRAYCAFLVKNVRISLFNVVCTKVFTFSPPKVLRERNIRSRNVKSSGVQTTKKGGSDPTFSAFSRPKKFRGVAPARHSEKSRHTPYTHQQHECVTRIQSQLGTRACAFA
jgi:hypothetical protein